MSGISKHEFKLGDNTFYIRRYEPFLGLEILGDLQKQFAAPMLGLLNGKSGGSEEENAAAFSAALARLSESIDGKTLSGLAKRLLQEEYIAVSIDNAPERKLNLSAINMSLTTTGDVLALCWEVITFNFAEVLQRIASPTGPAASFLRANRPENSAPSSLPN